MVPPRRSAGPAIPGLESDGDGPPAGCRSSSVRRGMRTPGTPSPRGLGRPREPRYGWFHQRGIAAHEASRRSEDMRPRPIDLARPTGSASLERCGTAPRTRVPGTPEREPEIADTATAPSPRHRPQEPRSASLERCGTAPRTRVPGTPEREPEIADTATAPSPRHRPQEPRSASLERCRTVLGTAVPAAPDRDRELERGPG
jgi:hypothetical protein